MKPINPTTIASELNLSVKRDYGGQTLNEYQVIDAAVQKYWEKRATIQIKKAS